MVNELLPGASPMGAYCLGILSSVAIMVCVASGCTAPVPDRQTMDRALRCTTVDEGQMVANEWMEPLIAAREKQKTRRGKHA